MPTKDMSLSQKSDVFIPGVLTEPWPHELALSVLAEPVHMEDLWQLGRVLDTVRHRKPVVEVVAHIVASKWKHGKWIEPIRTSA